MLRFQTMIARSLLLLLAASFLAGCQHPTPYLIGAYGVRNPAELREIKEAGFNLAVGTAEKEYIRAAESLGMHILASPNTSAGTNFNPSAARAAVRDFDRSAALWAWYLADEPDIHDVPPGELQRAHTFFKDIRASKPTAAVIFDSSMAKFYGDITDILMVDPYPVGWLPLSKFSQGVRLGHLAQGKGKPLLAVIQAFDWSAFPESSPVGGKGRVPTPKDLRCMAYMALAEGASGILFYVYKSGTWNLPDHPQTWEAVKALVAEIRALEPLFQARTVWWPLQIQYPDQQQALNETLQGAITSVCLQTESGNEFLRPGRYILCVNTTGRRIQYQLRFPSNSGDMVNVLKEDRTVHLNDGWMTDSFDDYAVHIYGPLSEP